MSKENVELIERSWARFARSGVRTGFAEEIEWHLDSGHPDQRVLRGLQEVEEYFRGWDESFDGMRVDVAEYLDRGDDVITPFVARARPRGSNAEVELAETWILTVRDGLIVKVREYLTKDEALADLSSG